MTQATPENKLHPLTETLLAKWAGIRRQKDAERDAEAVRKRAERDSEEAARRRQDDIDRLNRWLTDQGAPFVADEPIMRFAGFELRPGRYYGDFCLDVWGPAPYRLFDDAADDIVEARTFVQTRTRIQTGRALAEWIAEPRVDWPAEAVREADPFVSEAESITPPVYPEIYRVINETTEQRMADALNRNAAEGYELSSASAYGYDGETGMWVVVRKARVTP